MSTTNNWTILGTQPVAERLRQSAQFVESPIPRTIATEPTSDPLAFVLGPALLESTGRVIPFLAAFEALEAVRDALRAGQVGKVYGYYTSFRIERGASAADVRDTALLPALAIALDTVPGTVVRVWAKRASLCQDGDAWFVTMRMADDTLLTVEAAALAAPGTGRELLVEVTGAERVLRAEPTRQAVAIEPLDGPPRLAPWWEDLAERYLHLIVARGDDPDADIGQHLRAVWQAVQQSAASGQPVPLA
jgi:predicted dehydrogenase